jgi:hypothetical protein
VSGAPEDGRPSPRHRIEAGRWDLEWFDPDRHEDPPEDLEEEEPADEEEEEEEET